MEKIKYFVDLPDGSRIEVFRELQVGDIVYSEGKDAEYEEVEGKITYRWFNASHNCFVFNTEEFET